MTGSPPPSGLRIAVVLTGTTGGIGRHVAGQVPRLLALGHRVRVWCPAEVAGGALAGTDVPLEPLSRLHRIRGAQVVHAHGYKAAALAAPFARAAGLPLISTWHNDIPPSGPPRLVGRLLRRLSARTSAQVLGVSSDLVAAARRLGAPAALMPVPAPARRPAVQDRAAVRSALGLPADATVVVCVARLAAQKNLDLLLEVAARTGRDPAGPSYLVAGDGPERHRLQQRIDTEGLPVLLLGRRDDVPDLLAAADLALNTSRWEGSSLAVQEVLQAGVPLILTDVGGNRDLVGDGAVLVPAGDPAAAARQVRRLAGDPQARADLRRAALDRARQWPDDDALADRLDRLYRRLAQP